MATYPTRASTPGIAKMRQVGVGLGLGSGYLDGWASSLGFEGVDRAGRALGGPFLRESWGGREGVVGGRGHGTVRASESGPSAGAVSAQPRMIWRGQAIRSPWIPNWRVA